jgi:hypothetical protein
MQVRNGQSERKKYRRAQRDDVAEQQAAENSKVLRTEILAACPSAKWLGHTERCSGTRHDEGVWDYRTERMVAPYISKTLGSLPESDRTVVQTNYLFQMLNTQGTTVFSCCASGGFEAVRVETTERQRVEAILGGVCFSYWGAITSTEEDATYYAYQTAMQHPAGHFVLRKAQSPHWSGLVGKVELATSTNSEGDLVGELQLNVEPIDVAFALGVAHGTQQKELELFSS